MSVPIQVEIYGPQGGIRLGYLDSFTRLIYSRKVNDIGRLEMDIATKNLPDRVLTVNNQFQRDLRIAIWYQVQGQPLRLDMDTVWFVRSIEFRETKNGEVCTIFAVDANDLLRRRIVAAYVTSPEAFKNGNADIIMKAYVREALGTLASAARQFPGVTVQNDMTLGPVITREAGWRNLLAILQECAQESASLGTFIAFDIVAIDPSTLQFQVFVNQRGADQRSSLPIGTAYGNLVDTSMLYNTEAEVTHAYAGGAGEALLRDIAEFEAIVRRNLSVYNRIEVFIDARNSDDTVTPADAKVAVREGRPRINFQGTLVDTQAVQYGRDYKFGDMVRVQTRRGSFDARIDAIQVTVEAGRRIIETKLWADEDTIA